MNLDSIKAIAFDFDGTLAPLNIDFEFLKSEMKKLALLYVDESYLNNVDHLYTLEMIYEIEVYLGGRGERFKEAAFSKLREIELHFASKKELFPGSRSVLLSLKEMGMRLAIITRNCKEAVIRVFPDYREYVEVIVSREDVARVKPDPEHPRKALLALGADPSLSIICGDHPTDVIAGKALGAYTVGVLTGRTKREDFVRYGADLVIPSIDFLPRLIKSHSLALYR